MLMEDLPTKFTHFKSLYSQWELMPTFLVGEYLFYILTLIALYHALRSGYWYTFIWFAALFTGTCNDIFFMFLPLVDNFWQAQATIMLSERLPLYIPCVYICFMYYSVVAAEQLSINVLSSATSAGVLALLFYGPYDVVGAHFLWWTWHETDPSVSQRLIGVPVGSSLWVLTFASAFYLLLQICKRLLRSRRFRNIIFAFALICILTTPLMLVQMFILQLIDQQHIPTLSMLLSVAALYLTITFLGIVYSFMKNAVILKRERSHIILMIATYGYFLTLSIIAIFGNPEKHISMGVHQTFGPCNITSQDLLGHVRRDFICDSDNDHNFYLKCLNHNPKTYESWYPVCGKPASNMYFLYGVLLLAVLGSFTYAGLYTNRKIYQPSPVFKEEIKNDLS